MVTGKRVATGANSPAYVETDLVIVDAMARRITIRQRLPAVEGPDGLVALRLSEDGRWVHLVRKEGGPLLFDTKTEAFVELDPKSAGGGLQTAHYLSDYEVVELDTGRRWTMPFARRP